MDAGNPRATGREIVTTSVVSYHNANVRWYAARNPGKWGEPMGEGATEAEARADLLKREEAA